jgi:hypothetical protein
LLFSELELKKKRENRRFSAKCCDEVSSGYAKKKQFLLYETKTFIVEQILEIINEKLNTGYHGIKNLFKKSNLNANNKLSK